MARNFRLRAGALCLSGFQITTQRARYSFAVREAVVREELRSLRNEREE